MTHPLSIAFIWHMHQPYYRNVRTGVCTMPWVRLHAAKDYLDMVKRLEAHPSIHQTFNWVPSLMDQLMEYLPPAGRSDAFLEISRKPADTLGPDEKRFILQWFFLANPERMIKPYPRYYDLLAKRGMSVPDADWPATQRRFRLQDYRDLQVWFNLAWIDPWLRSQDPALQQLVEKGSHFTEEDKHAVLDAHVRFIAQVVPAYREAADRGQIELSTSPYYHPILPLLCDTRSARAGLPHAPLPEPAFRHPEDAHWHLQQALAHHAQAFGRPAAGLWPSEGSVSEDAIRIALECGVRWMATDEEILWRSLKTSRTAPLLYRPHVVRRQGKQLAMVFRDRELSDRIGFVYSQWEPRLAVADFLKRLESIHESFRQSPVPPLVSILLDGENAWEYFADDGHQFLTHLYQALAADSRFRCVTVSEFLAKYPLEHAESLPELFSGSWIDANFATWIGHPEKNTAWTFLAAAREAIGAPDEQNAARVAAWKSLGAAEGSDWMWWFGDTHFTAQADEFDRLFRAHLANAYQALGLAVPAALEQPIRQRSVRPQTEPTGVVQPVIDGRDTSYYEWLYAGRIDLLQQSGAMQRSEQYCERLLYGFDQQSLYLRIDLTRPLPMEAGAWQIALTLSGTIEVTIALEATGTSARLADPSGPITLPCAAARVIELAIPRHLLAVGSGTRLDLAVRLMRDGQQVERCPGEGAFGLKGTPEELEPHQWPV